MRVLYKSDLNTEQDQWINKHGAEPQLIANIGHYIKSNGIALNRLEYPYEIVKIQGKTQMMLYVIDDNLSRRHLINYQKIELVLMRDPLEKKLAKE